MPTLRVLLILIPAPFVGYLVVDSFRSIFSEDPTLVRGLIREQPVTMLAAMTALGSVIVWAASIAIARLLGL
jgi:hypothetical protein